MTPSSTPPPAGPRISAAEIAAALRLPVPTEQQQAIIEHPPAPMLVVAGAGSGKTETMAARVVWLVANGYAEPEQVLGLTFTRKAAAELAGRVGTRLRALTAAGVIDGAAGARPEETDGVVAAPPTISTYHAYAGRLVREHALRLGREPDARLLSEAAAWQYAHAVVSNDEGPLEQIGKAESTITNAVIDLAGEMAEHLVTPEQLDAWLAGFDERLEVIEGAGRALLAESKAMRKALRARRSLVPVLQRYAALKRDHGAMDFADQMAVAAELAMRFPEVGRIERERFSSVLLDEFQDTSHAQLHLLAALFAAAGAEGPGHCVTAVGDPHQSIYAWRGASAATLAQFPAVFGAASVSVLPLSVTWRNDRAILDAANTVAEPLRAGAVVPVEPLSAAPAAGDGRIEVARLETVDAEAALVADWIAQARAEGAQSAAVLCRKRSQFPAVVDALEAAGLPVEVVGLGGLLMTPEVQDVVALLTIAHDAGRGDRSMRLLTGPVCRLGAADLDALAAWARSRQHPPGRRGASSRDSDLSDAASDRVSLVEGLVDLAAASLTERAATGLSPAAVRRLLDLAAALAGVRAVTGSGLVDIVAEAERALGLDIEILARPGYPVGVARAHLDAFTDVAADFAAGGDRPTLGGFLAWLDAALAEERGLDRGVLDIVPGAVHVLTVHAAKGLEWDAVAIPGLVESGFPAHGSATSKFDPDTGRWRSSEPGDGAWTIGLDGLPYDLRGDAALLPAFAWRSAADAKELDDRRAAFRVASGAAGIAEERRLAYVALTRARRAMLLTCAVWGGPKTPRVPSRFLLELREQRPDLLTTLGWCPDPPADATNPALAEPVSVNWPPHAPVADPVREGAGAVAAAMGRPDLSDHVLPREVAVLVAERQARIDGSGSFPVQSAPGGPWRLLDALGGHVSTSQLVSFAAGPDDFAVGVRRPMPQRPSVGTRRGTAFHAWIERHYRRAALLEPDDLPGSADPDTGEQVDLEDLVARFRASDWAEREPLDVEVMVETVVAGTAVRGRIDAVFLEPDGSVTIVDWKSGAPPGGQEAHAAAVQLATYRIAYARLTGRDPDTVRAAFYYAATGETVYPPLRSASELTALVATLRG